MELQNWFVEFWNFLLLVYVIIVIEGYCNLNLTFRLLSSFFAIIIIIIIIIIIKQYYLSSNFFSVWIIIFK